MSPEQEEFASAQSVIKEESHEESSDDSSLVNENMNESAEGDLEKKDNFKNILKERRANCFYAFSLKIIKSSLFTWFINLSIIANLALLALNSYPDDLSAEAE